MQSAPFPSLPPPPPSALRPRPWPRPRSHQPPPVLAPEALAVSQRAHLRLALLPRLPPAAQRDGVVGPDVVRVAQRKARAAAGVHDGAQRGQVAAGEDVLADEVAGVAVRLVPGRSGEARTGSSEPSVRSGRYRQQHATAIAASAIRCKPCCQSHRSSAQQMPCSTALPPGLSMALTVRK